MIIEEEFKTQIMESKTLGYATDNLLELIEDIVNIEAASKKISWGQTDVVNTSMIDYTMEAFESNVAQKIINNTTFSSSSKMILAMTKQNCNCLFNQFRSKFKADITT